MLLQKGLSSLDTVRYCEKVRDLDFISLLDTIFSRLVTTHYSVLTIISIRPKFPKYNVCHTPYASLCLLELADHNNLTCNEDKGADAEDFLHF